VSESRINDQCLLTLSQMKKMIKIKFVDVDELYNFCIHDFFVTKRATFMMSATCEKYIGGI
jgi:hypothetical protein